MKFQGHLTFRYKKDKKYITFTFDMITFIFMNLFPYYVYDTEHAILIKTTVALELIFVLRRILQAYN